MQVWAAPCPGHVLLSLLWLSTLLYLSVHLHFTQEQAGPICLNLAHCKATKNNCRFVLHEQRRPIKTLHHSQMFPVDTRINTHTHPGQGRRKPTAAPQPSAVSGSWACPRGQNQSSCFPPEKRDTPRRCSR